MKPLACAVATLSLVAGVAAAQQSVMLRASTPDIERLAVLLDLDEYQKNEVERVLAEQRETRRFGSLEEMQAHQQHVRQETRGKLQNVLSELQLTKLDLLMEEPQGRVLVHRQPASQE